MGQESYCWDKSVMGVVICYFCACQDGLVGQAFGDAP